MAIKFYPNESGIQVGTYTKARIVCDEQSTNISNNTSHCVIYVQMCRTNSGYTTYGNGTLTLTIGGTAYNSTITTNQVLSNSWDWRLIGGITVLDIGHSSDGTYNIFINAKSTVNNSPNMVFNFGGYIELIPIPRISVPTLSTSSANFGDSITIYTNRKSNSFTHHIYYKADGMPNEVGIVADVANSYTWTIPKELMNNIPNSKSMRIMIRVYTFNGSTNIGNNTVWFTAYTTENLCAPKITVFSIAPNNAGLNPKFKNVYISGKSKVKATTAGIGKYNATIKTSKIEIYQNGKWQGLENLLSQSGTRTIRLTITDSRGYTATQSKTITVLPYSQPYITKATNESIVKCYRGDNVGIQNGSSETIYAALKKASTAITENGVNLNNSYLQYEARLTTGNWTDTWNTLSTNSNNDFKGLLPGSFDKTKTYNIRFSVYDDLSGTSGKYIYTQFNIPTDDVTLDLGEGGRIVGIGRYADKSKDKSLSVAFDSYFDKGVFMTEIGNAIKLNYIIEQGSKFYNGFTWKYRKWKDGVLEYWTCLNVNTQMNIDKIKTLIFNIPIAFINNSYRINLTPMQNGNVVNRYWIGTIGGNQDNITKTTFDISVEMKSSNNYDTWFYTHIIGEWK
ncbi:MAG: DUF859 family phage minor structural protein [Candidatus Fimenecus sp.]